MGLDERIPKKCCCFRYTSQKLQGINTGAVFGKQRSGLSSIAVDRLKENKAIMFLLCFRCFMPKHDGTKVIEANLLTVFLCSKNNCPAHNKQEITEKSFHSAELHQTRSQSESDVTAVYKLNNNKQTTVWCEHTAGPEHSGSPHIWMDPRMDMHSCVRFHGKYAVAARHMKTRSDNNHAN